MAAQRYDRAITPHFGSVSPMKICPLVAEIEPQCNGGQEQLIAHNGERRRLEQSRAGSRIEIN
jgi:hypothetical protein